MYKDKKVEIKWKQGLGLGLDQSTDEILTEGAQYLKNVSLDKPGKYITRKGSSLIFDKIGSNPGYGLMTYNKTDGTHKMAAVTDQDLYFLDEVSGWGVVETDKWPADTRVDGVTHLDRLYLGSQDGATALSYSTGSSVTDITPKIGGSIMATSKAILAVGGNVLKPNVIFFTDPFTDRFYSATGITTTNPDSNGAKTLVTTETVFESDTKLDAFVYSSNLDALAYITDWTSATVPYVTTDTDTSTWTGNTIYVLTNNFQQDGACTGLITFGDKFLSFDENKMYLWDPTSKFRTDELENFGCVNYRTVKVIDGYAIWVGRDAIYLMPQGNRPIPIMNKIKDEENGYGVWDLFDRANVDEICAGINQLKGEYHLSLGTLSTVSGAAYSGQTKTVAVYNVRTQEWRVDVYQDQPLAYTNFIDTNGSKDLHFIGKTDAAVFKTGTGTTDDDSNGDAQSIDFDVKVPWSQLYKDPTVTSKVSGYYTKYTSAGDVVVKAGKDRESYKTASTLALASTIKTERMPPSANMEGIEHSMQFTGSSKTSIEAYGFEVQGETTTRETSK